VKEILLVDDDQYFLRLVRNLLVQEGMAVQCASSGEEGLLQLKNRPFILMITDFNMPELDGLQLARKSREIAPHMPIIMSSGNISPELPRLATKAGIVAVIAKPFRSDELLEAVRGVIEIQSKRALLV
jgi:DNA-binding response OmpR family regulator